MEDGQCAETNEKSINLSIWGICISLVGKMPLPLQIKLQFQVHTITDFKDITSVFIFS